MPNKEPKKVEVLVAYTKPEMWEAVKQKHIAVQGNNSADADYIAFIRTGSKDKEGKRLAGVLTHIARVREIRSEQPASEYYKGNPSLAALYEEKGWTGTGKEYYLEEIEELSKSIPHRKGCPPRSRVKFYTTLEQIRKAKVLQDIKTLSRLESEKK